MLQQETDSPADRTTKSLQSMLDEAGEAFLEFLDLRSTRTLALVAADLGAMVREHFRRPAGATLTVQQSDATWDNARFVANVLVPHFPFGKSYVPPRGFVLCVVGGGFVVVRCALLTALGRSSEHSRSSRRSHRQ